jgi:glycine cleavage system H protein
MTASNIPADLLYTHDHEYVRIGADGVAEIGITDFAQGELGDIVFVELPTAGDPVTAHAEFGTVEAVKAVSELNSPVTGEVVAVNPRLDKEPALINNDPYGEGWMIRVRLTDPKARDGLLTAQAYATQIGA